MTVKTGPMLVEVTFYGNTTVGTFSVPGVKAGDVIISVRDVAGSFPFPDDGSGPRYRPIVTTDDELDQMGTPTNWSTTQFVAILVRWS